ncbi:MAG: sensor histidine kinase [Labilithrix sp.]|nr:sensor histidine kinase [Labilithrix sp.]
MHTQRLRELHLEDSELQRRAGLLEDAERVAHIGSWEWVIGTGKTRWSDESFRTLGHEPGAIEPSFELFMDHVVPEDRAQTAEILERVVGSGRGETVELRVRRHDDTVRDLSIRIEVLVDRAGKAARLVGVMQDVTERNEILAARANAERKQAALVKELEEVNRELGEFAYVVSHDLKAPLRGIGSLADWIARDQRDRLDGDGKEQLDLLLGRVKRMNELIEGILRYSRIGRAKEEIVTLDTRQICAEVIDLIAPPPHVSVFIDGAMPSVRTARTQLAQVFQNLIGNAIKFCDKATGEVRVSCVEEPARYVFTTSDNGPGIEARHFQRIFHIFQTLAPRDKTQNTGIGLSIVKKIVETMGGQIWVESTVGAGSRFSFTIPKNAEST